MRTVIGGLLAAGMLAAPAFAQSSAGTWNDLSDRFQIDTGYFRLTADTVLRYSGPGGAAGEVDFEKDLGQDAKVNTFWVDGTWRVGRRHQLKLSFTQMSRERDDVTLQRDFVRGGETYNAGLSATSTNSSDILAGYYRLAIVRSDRFEIGPTIGVGYLWVDAGNSGIYVMGTYRLIPIEAGTRLSVSYSRSQGPFLKRITVDRMLKAMIPRAIQEGGKALRELIERDLAEGKTVPTPLVEVPSDWITQAAASSLVGNAQAT